MSKNGFWTVFAWMRDAMQALNLPTEHNVVHRATNAYLLAAYDNKYNPLTYTDETGETACRRWLSDRMKEMAA